MRLSSNLIRIILPLLTLLSVPFVYNSCQGGFDGSAASAASAKCKVVVEDGLVTKMKMGFDQIPQPFSVSKVALRADLDSTSTYAKTTGPLEINAGTELGVILDNQCLLQRTNLLGDTIMSKAALDSNEMIDSLERQAYLWILDRNYNELEIEEIANREICVIGLSWNKSYALQSTFNDPGLSKQAYLPSINAEEAYTKFYGGGTGGMDSYGSPLVVLAAVDTGVDWQHPDLRANMWTHNQGVGIDVPTLGTALVNFNPFDISTVGHGTHIAGMMAAASHNAMGIVGAMPFRAQVMAVKIFKPSGTSVTTSSQYLYNGVNFAHANNASVINVSVDAITNGPASDALLNTSFAEAVQAGSVVVVAIGNAAGGASGGLVDGVNLTSIPAIYSTIQGVIGVGSYDTSTGKKSQFSHYSTTYGEIAAPGGVQGTTGLYSTIPTALGGYGYLAGTSQAAPLVSASAGLTIGLIKKAYNNAPPTPKEVESLILAGSAKSTDLVPYFKDGNRLDLKLLVEKINKDYPKTMEINPVVSTPTATPACP